VTLPYITVSPPPGVGVFGAALIAAGVTGVAAAWLTARALALAGGEAVAIAGLCAVAGLIGAHAFEIAWYRPEDAGDVRVWLRVTDGVSLFGALGAGGLVALLWMRARQLDLAAYADALAVGCLVALVVGRVGCALVHDHPGAPTALPIGVDFPGGVRLHDLGLEELALLVPLMLVGMFLFGLRVRPGTVAAFAALAYAGLRLGLDFLRSPATEPRLAGLTGGQLGSIALVIATLIALVVRARSGPGRKGRRSTMRVRVPTPPGNTLRP